LKFFEFGSKSTKFQAIFSRLYEIRVWRKLIDLTLQQAFYRLKSPVPHCVAVAGQDALQILESLLPLAERPPKRARTEQLTPAGAKRNVRSVRNHEECSQCKQFRWRKC